MSFDGFLRSAEPIVVRVLGGPSGPVGSEVSLRVRGPVFAWRAG